MMMMGSIFAESLRDDELNGVAHIEDLLTLMHKAADLIETYEGALIDIEEIASDEYQIREIEDPFYHIKSIINKALG